MFVPFMKAGYGSEWEIRETGEGKVTLVCGIGI